MVNDTLGRFKIFTFDIQNKKKQCVMHTHAQYTPTESLDKGKVTTDTQHIWKPNTWHASDAIFIQILVLRTQTVESTWIRLALSSTSALSAVLCLDTISMNAFGT